MARKTIVALYDRAPDAEAARTRLRDAGIPDDDIELVSHSGFGAGSGHGEIVPRMTGWGVPYDEALVYADGLRAGGVLLVASLLKTESVDRAVALLGGNPGAPSAPEPAGYETKPVPDAMSAGPSSPDMGDAVAARRAARATESETSLSDAARAMRDTNATGRPPGRAAAPKAETPDVYVDRPETGERR
ncbi:hypothetical protein [Azospirillum sp. ST 5-10]|uniref:hypothetical protein n=1 Tax=unclassified Azospirillum TaxID=2630922 RepID=UPI003F4A2052